jgi:hypothetical protein
MTADFQISSTPTCLIRSAEGVSFEHGDFSPPFPTNTDWRSDKIESYIAACRCLWVSLFDLPPSIPQKIYLLENPAFGFACVSCPAARIRYAVVDTTDASADQDEEDCLYGQSQLRDDRRNVAGALRTERDTRERAGCDERPGPLEGRAQLNSYAIIVNRSLHDSKAVRVSAMSKNREPFGRMFSGW